MKTKILSAMIFCAMSSSVYAGDSVDLKITGKLTNAACTPTIENGGVIDLGHIPVKNLSPVSTIGYENKSIQHTKIAIDIVCPTALKIGYKVTDNNPGTLPTGFEDYWGAYGFGQTSDNKKIGIYQLYHNQSTVDGVAGRLIYSTNQGSTWTPGSGLTPLDYIFAFATGETSTPVSGKNYHMRMDTTYYFGKEVVDSLQDSLELNGKTTFTLVYL